jgi:adenylate kinase family enzyme
VIADFFPRYDYFSLLERSFTCLSPFPRFSPLKGMQTSHPAYARDLEAAVDRLRVYFDEGQDIPPLNCLILGPPGAGKTFLAKELAASFSHLSVKFEEHNLSQLDKPDHIANRLFEASNDRKLVFVDEFDVTVSGSSVVRFILDPLTKKRRCPTVYVFSGSYLKNIHVLRALGKRSTDFDFPRFLLDVYLRDQTQDSRRETLELYQACSYYNESRQKMTPDSDVVAYLKNLDKLQDFLSRINGFVIQIPDISAPMTITRLKARSSFGNTWDHRIPIKSLMRTRKKMGLLEYLRQSTASSV